MSERPRDVGVGDLARYFLKLGALGFGGPIALAGSMQRDLVERRGWITQPEYLEGLAVAQTLPGPLAAQLAMWFGYVQRGFWGATAAAIAFVLPPFVLVCAIAAVYVAFAGTTAIQALFYGIGPAVIALILRGAWKLLRVTVKRDPRLWVIFAVVAAITFALRTEVAILFVLAGLLGVVLYAPPRWFGRLRVVPAFVPLGALAAAAAQPDVLLQLGIFFFKAGAFTFGSGLAIVPFLEQGVVRDFGWLDQRQFLDAVAIGMITPGPVVITAVFVGYLVAGLAGASVAAVGVFLPPYLMVVLFAPVIIRYRAHPAVRGFTKGATSAAAGAIVGAAAVIATQVLVDLATVAIFAIAFIVLWRTKLPEPALVGASALVGIALFALR